MRFIGGSSLLLLVSVVILSLTAANPSPALDARAASNEADDVDAVTVADNAWKEEMKRQLKEELLASLWDTAHYNEYRSLSRPHHYHHYHHHHCQKESGSILAQELVTLKALLQATDTKLQMKEAKLQTIEARLLAVESSRLDDQTGARDTQEDRSHTCEDKLIATHERLEAAERKVAQLMDRTGNTTATSHANSSMGSTFIRWGRSTCPNTTHLVYSGVAGGSHYSHTGGGSNRLCLSLEPQYDITFVPSEKNYLYGVEYQDIPQHRDDDAPCAVCRAPQPTTIMVPGTYACPKGWVTQYTGHLVAGSHNHQAGSEHLCLDAQPEDRSSGDSDQDGALFYYVITVCGSLPCPPYISLRVATCAVCSM